ncbi:hypothetical protein HG535_0B03670 [Zygotorulaspora mrakii]|uniref:T6SS Phospholipase effector Tle1-like catalytic domain-containing protein n=1 Tax=Zygotorulaspora mrakii TaxID=42260 RepID=A0A7H9AY32_ZYGMR|nr:uncharacterized protein HG535_0B03670 [Zygotorulaspora mrakii]QLG71328.1 hypothetical protein HG535_0B03670 [Zygotorulaspora mrakii]
MGVNKRKQKNLVLCFDGTRENFGPQPITNVLKIYQMLENDNSDIQVCYYQPGIGTEPGFDPVIDVRRRFTTSHWSNVTDAMFASTVDHHVVSGYVFLMENYENGDNIHMFGFSRGAFIARALAGMLERVGLLYRGLNDMVSMAWRIYELWEYAEQPSQPNYNVTLADEFKRTFCRSQEVRVYFQGLFDSVNSVGILRDRLFPCTQRSGIVDHVRHAVSVDERKGKFKQQSFAPNPNACLAHSVNTNSNYDSMSYSTSPSSDLADCETGILESSDEPSLAPSHTLKPDSDANEHNARAAASGKKESNLLKRVNEFLEDTEQFPQTLNSLKNSFLNKSLTENSGSKSTLTPDLVEKWFMGDHSDVGGGWGVDCKTGDSVSNMALRWMLCKAVEHGVVFKKESIHEFAKRNTPIGSLISTIHDKLSFKQAIKIEAVKPPEVICTEDLEAGNGHYLATSGAIPFTNMLRDFFKFKETEILSNEETTRQKYSSICGGISKLETFFWWCLELIPIGLRTENESGKWRNIYVPNLGRSRFVPSYAELHWSVFWRIKHDKRYRPKNLPAYAYKILEEFQDISIDSPMLRDLETIASPFKSYPTLSGTEERLLNTSEIVYVKDSIVQAQYRKTKRKLLEWESEQWLKVPDDLEKVLKSDPLL